MKRKARSEALISSLGLPINPTLPELGDEKFYQLRSQPEVVDRILALAYVAAKAQGAPAEILAYIDDEYHALAKLTANEQEFVQQRAPTEPQIVQFSWRYEAAIALCWSAGLIEELSFPPQTSPSLVDTLSPYSQTELAQVAKLRPVSEILDQLDLTYRLAWACRELSLTSETSEELKCGVVWERLRALNWLTIYDEADWDDVSLDT